MSDFQVKRTVKCSRKPCKCEGCSRAIPRGSEVANVTGHYEGDFYSLRYHPECLEAETHYNHESGLGGDDWCPLKHIDEPDDKLWIAGAFPIVGHRMGWKVPKSEDE